MPGKFFLDTNILVYTFDKSSPVKRNKALAIVGEAIEDQAGVISYQVVQEFINVASRKFSIPLHPDDLRAYAREILFPLCDIHSSVDLYKKAMDIAGETGFSFYDCLIIAGALEAGCRTLYSEDLQSGRSLNGLRIVNPF